MDSARGSGFRVRRFALLRVIDTIDQFVAFHTQLHTFNLALHGPGMSRLAVQRVSKCGPFRPSAGFGRAAAPPRAPALSAVGLHHCPFVGVPPPVRLSSWVTVVGCDAKFCYVFWVFGVFYWLTGSTALPKCAVPRRWAGPIPDPMDRVRSPASCSPSMGPGLLRSGR